MSCYLCGKNGFRPFSCPKDPKIREKWYQFCELIDDGRSPCLRLCENHFTESDICRKTKENGRTKLRKTAVPSKNPENLNPCPNHERTTKATCEICSSLGLPDSFSTLRKAYFKFPKDSTTRKEWVKFCEIEESDLPANPKLCSLHFNSGDLTSYSGRVYTKFGAKPVLFDITNRPSQNVGESHQQCETAIPENDESSPDNCDHLEVDVSVLFNESDMITSSSGDAEMSYSNSGVSVLCDDSNPTFETSSVITSTPSHPNLLQDESSFLSTMLSILYLFYSMSTIFTMIQAEFCEGDSSTVRTPKKNIANHLKAQDKRKLNSPNTPRTRKTKRTCKRTLRYMGDVKYSDFEDPEKAQESFFVAYDTAQQYKKKTKNLQKQVNRLKSTLKNFRGVVNDMKKKEMLSEQTVARLTENLPTSMMQMLDRQMHSKSTKYPAALRSFALTLQFISTKAYEYVRSTWKNLLPNVSTLRRWYSVVNGAPGFTTESFKALKAKTKNGPVTCTLVVDEMSIKEMVEYKNNKIYGYENLGTGLMMEDTDFPLTAKQALVFLVVSVKEGWKIPVAYFLINKLTGLERGNLLKICLQMLHDAKVNIVAVTFDGAPTNFNMLKSLGANFSVDESLEPKKPWFTHPADEKQKVYAYPDPCHMIKLVRNCLLEKKEMIYFNGDQERNVMWSDIQNLHEEERRQELRVTKLTKKHIDCSNNKMNVRLAVQTLSASVRDGLLWLKDFNPAFLHCEATAQFCSVMNDIFDLLNCRSKFSKRSGQKPVSDDTKVHLEGKMNSFIDYIKHLKIEETKAVKNPENDEEEQLEEDEDDPDAFTQDSDPEALTPLEQETITSSYVTVKEKHILRSGRKIGFLGLIICMRNLIPIFEAVRKFDAGQTYLLTYKLLQDALENFFCAVRSFGGHSNNPTSRLFEAAYKRLLIHHETRTFEAGNCSVDDMEILHATKTVSSTTVDPVIDVNEAGTGCDIDDIDGNDIPPYERLNRYVNDVTEYIAGYILKKLLDKGVCRVCLCHLETVVERKQPLVDQKNRGGLYKASRDCVKVCQSTEVVFRENKHLIMRPNFADFIARKTYLKIFHTVFQTEVMRRHTSSQPTFEGHHQQLIKIIATIYAKIRINHEMRLRNEKEKYVRQKLTKYIHFVNQ